MLVAISIPIFTSQLEKSKEATDLANIRSAYAEVMSAALTDTAATHDDSLNGHTLLRPPEYNHVIISCILTHNNIASIFPVLPDQIAEI